MTTLPMPPAQTPAGLNFAPLITGFATFSAPFIAKYLGMDSAIALAFTTGATGAVFHFAEQYFTQPKK